MAIRKFPGFPTVDGGIFWQEVCAQGAQGGWRVQYNATLDAVSPFRPYRLLDPGSHVWAAAVTAEELTQALPALIEEFSARSPLFTRDDVRQILGQIAQILLAFGARRLERSLPPRDGA